MRKTLKKPLKYPVGTSPFVIALDACLEGMSPLKYQYIPPINQEQGSISLALGRGYAYQWGGEYRSFYGIYYPSKHPACGHEMARSSLKVCINILSALMGSMP